MSSIGGIVEHSYVACLERVKWFYYTCAILRKQRNKLTLQIVDCCFDNNCLKLPQLHDIANNPYLPVQCSLLNIIHWVLCVLNDPARA